LFFCKFVEVAPEGKAFCHDTRRWEAGSLRRARDFQDSDQREAVLVGQGLA